GGGRPVRRLGRPCPPCPDPGLAPGCDRRASPRWRGGLVSTLVAGIDSSTQSCKVTVRRLNDGTLVREGRAEHPRETIVDAERWWDALLLAVDRAGGLADVAAISVSGQQHTPVFIGADGDRACDAPLWNDLGSHPQRRALNE